MVNYNISPKNKEGLPIKNKNSTIKPKLNGDEPTKKENKSPYFAWEIIQLHLLYISSTFTYN